MTVVLLFRVIIHTYLLKKKYIKNRVYSALLLWTYT